MILGDSNVNAATKGYIENPNFGLRGREDITCWDLMQLLNDAAKQSYIDKFLERNQNCTENPNFGVTWQRGYYLLGFDAATQ